MPDSASPMGFYLNRVGGNLAEPLDVYVEPAGGTATAGEDYVTPTGPVQFAANQTGKALSVAVIDDPWHEPMESLALAVRNLMLGSAAAAYVSSDDLLAVHSVEWDGVAASDGATNFEADPYENMGDGFRLFPEKNKPPSIDEHAPLHDRAKVVVTLNGKVAPGETVPVYCKLFDVDDPTAFMDAVDSNDLPGHRVEDRAYMGDDNRPPGVGPGNPSIVLGAGQDVAWFEYSFARCQPGDNFRAFATTDQALFNEVQLDVYVENGDSRVNPFRRGLDRANKPPGKYASKTLAIWRKFHVELDSMAAPGAGEVFDAQNDDVNPGGPARKPDISLAKANFRPAFIEVVDDLAAWDITDGVTWDRNVEDAELVVFPGQGVLQEKRDVIGDAGFWAMPLVGGYELSEGKDNDPANERPTWLGVTAHGVGSFIALETIRDMAESGFIGYKPKETIEQRTVVHELAHHFRGIRHGDPSGAGDEGPLSNTNNLRGTDAQNQFTDRQLALLRSDENPCDDR